MVADAVTTGKPVGLIPIDKSRFGHVAFEHLTEGGDAAARQKARVGK